VLVAAWVAWELRAEHPLVDVRLLRHRVVLGANATVLLVGVGSYPLLSLVVRLVQTPTATGYGFGASPLVAGLLLVPFSLASFASNRTIGPMLRRGSPEVVVAWCSAGLLATMVLFLFARSTVWELVIVMALAGYGVGLVFAANPLQIVRGVPAGETASATGFYQVLRSVGFSVGSALSATALEVSVPSGRTLPTDAGYRTAALIGIGVLVVATVVAVRFARRPANAAAPS
jgi:predicted MFS family arabinose efflux permease